MYTGHPKDWEWIRNVRNWDKKATERWQNGTYHHQFERKNGATCTRSAYFNAGLFVRVVSFGIFDGSGLIGHLCSCKSSVAEKVV
jgi:hypothetical protein